MLATASKVLAVTGIAIVANLALGSPPATADTDDTGCVVYTLGADPVAVHEQRSATSPVTGVLRPDQATGGGCQVAPGGHYAQCGGGNTWVTVARAGLRGFVPHACVEIIS